MAPPASRAVAAALAWLLAVPATYSVLRANDVLFGPAGADPAAISWSTHIAMFWRLGIGAYAAGVAAAVAYLAAEKHLAATIRTLTRLVIVVFALSGAQGLLMP
jgi:hypothetical protein